MATAIRRPSRRGAGYRTLLWDMELGNWKRPYARQVFDTMTQERHLEHWPWGT
jgi:hypothetical protein